MAIGSCLPDDDPAPSCTDAGEYELPATTQIVIMDTDNADGNNRWLVCSGAHLIVSGSLNVVVVKEGGQLTINGDDNTIYNLGGGDLTLNSNKNTVWLNGDSKTTNYGDKNFLYYYKTGQLYEYGSGTIVEDLCGNVEMIFDLVPAGGCP